MLLPILISLLLLQEKPAPEKPARKPDAVVVDPGAPQLSRQGEQPVEYAFNPYQANKELEVGSFHMKRGNYAAAVARFQEALKWNPRLAAAYLKLGEAYEKRGELKKALETYRKYLELERNSKKARQVQKAIARLERELKE